MYLAYVGVCKLPTSTVCPLCCDCVLQMGNMVLVVFVSYFGSRVNRPRFIGFGGLLMSCAAATLALPHFLSKPYQYHSMSAGKKTKPYILLSIYYCAGNITRQFFQNSMHYSAGWLGIVHFRENVCIKCIKCLKCS